MLEKHSAAEAIGFDVEPLVIDQANALALEKGLSDRAIFKCVKPGKLDTKDESFDVIFSKEAFIHIPNKVDLMKDINRTLKTNGYLAVGDWMRNDDNPPSIEMQEYIAAEGLDYYMCSLEKYRDILENTGFKVISLNDRNEWYLEKVKKEVVKIDALYGAKLLNQLELKKVSMLLRFGKSF